MTPSEFSDWIVTAQGQDARRIAVKRGTKPGQKNATKLFFEDDAQGYDVARSLERMRDDVRARRLTHAVFEVCALDDAGKALLSDRVTISRDEALPDTPEAVDEPGVHLARMGFDLADKFAHSMLDMSKNQQTVVGQLSEALVKRDERIEMMLSNMFDIFTLKNEREADIRKSEDTRAIAKDTVGSIAPIAGLLISKLAGQAAPAWGALVQSLLKDPERFQQFAAMLTPAEIATLEQAMNVTFPKKEST